MSRFGIKIESAKDLEQYMDSLAESADIVANWVRKRKVGTEPPTEVVQAANLIIIRTEQWRRM